MIPRQPLWRKTKQAARATQRSWTNRPSSRVLAMLGHSVAECKNPECAECKVWYADRAADQRYQDSIGG